MPLDLAQRLEALQLEMADAKRSGDCPACGCGYHAGLCGNCHCEVWSDKLALVSGDLFVSLDNEHAEYFPDGRPRGDYKQEPIPGSDEF